MHFYRLEDVDADGNLRKRGFELRKTDISAKSQAERGHRLISTLFKEKDISVDGVCN